MWLLMLMSNYCKAMYSVILARLVPTYSSILGVAGACIGCCGMQADRRLRHLALTRVVADLAHTRLQPLLEHHAARYAPGGEGLLARQAAAEWKQQQRERWQHAQATVPTPPIIATVANTPAGSNAAGDDLPLVAPWAITGKHLCGAATDYTLRAMLAAAKPSTPPAPANTEHEPAVTTHVVDQGSHTRQWCWRGGGLAPCCHHRCSWRAYVGKDIMRQAGISPAEFEIIAWLTGAVPCCALHSNWGTPEVASVVSICFLLHVGCSCWCCCVSS